jgi:F0F1-type ATP synthase assembly protein I
MDDDRPGPPPNKSSASSAYGSSMREAGPYLGLGIELTISMVFFVIAGYFADEWLGTSPWLLILGIALSVVATGFTLGRVVREANRASAAKKAAARRDEEGEGGHAR